MSHGRKASREWPIGHIMAAAGRSIAEDSGKFLFRVVNMRWAERNNLICYDDYPLRLRHQFLECPNYVEINAHRKWYQAQIEVGEGLALRIENEGVRAFVHTFEGDFIDIINSAYVDPADAAEEIHRLAFRLFQVAEHDRYDLPPSFVQILPDLDHDTVAILQTAEILRRLEHPVPDFSIAIIEYCKAVEVELKRKLLEPLRARIQAKTGQLAKPIGQLHRLSRYLSGKTDRPLELGTLAKTISAALSSSTSADDLLVLEIRDYLGRFPNPAWMTSQFAGDIEALARDFRNPAAHGRIQDPTRVEECRRIVLGHGEDSGLLHRLLGR
jgi:hypothetical protein